MGMCFISTGDRIADAAVAELHRLVTELLGRCGEGAYGAAVSSLTAMEPVRTLLLEQCGRLWLDTEDASTDLIGGYL
jgi:hypothetical protein